MRRNNTTSSEEKKGSEESKTSNSKELLGDDPGALKYLQFTSTLMFCDVPYIKEALGARLFTSAELIYYPSVYGKKNSDDGIFKVIQDDCRASIGVGINIPVNPMFHF